MNSAEENRAILFVAAVAGIYVMAGAIAVKSLLARLRGAVRPVRPIEVWISRIVFTLATIGLLCIAYGYFVEPYWLSVTHVTITSAKVQKGARPIRIALVSDLHSDPKVRLEQRLPLAVAAEKPDVIIFAGDTVNSPDALPVAQDCLSRLAHIAPTFAVKGNWDAWYWRSLKLFDGTGVRELNGDFVDLKVGDSEIQLGGIAVGNETALDQATLLSNHMRILVYHYPDLIQEASQRHVDLYIAGHTRRTSGASVLRCIGHAVEVRKAL